MKKDFLKYLWVILFLVVCSYFFYWDFQYFQEHKVEQQNIATELSKGLESFTTDSIEPIKEIDLRKTPNTKVIDEISKKIRNAKKRVYLNSYIFTEKNIRSSLIDAKKRGLDVKVVLEKNIYDAPNLNEATFSMLQAAQVDVVWSLSKNFSLDHAKYIVIDDSLVISTRNYSYSNFHDKTDFFMFVTDPKILQDVIDLFLWDFAGEKRFFYETNTILSSFDARKKLETLLVESTQSIDMYVPYIKDESLMKILLSKIQSWVKVRIITSPRNIDDKNILLLKKDWAQVVFSKKEVHAKAICFDKKVVYIGSLNFSASSIDENREVGLLISNPQTIEDFLWFFYWDFSPQK